MTWKDKAAFVEAFSGIFEHSPWVAERAFSEGVIASDVHGAMVSAFRAASHTERLAVLRAHPDLAGKLAAAKRLTADSSAEQASAGLDALTDDERVRFTKLNDAYTAKHGFPFIIAVRDHTKASILGAFERRIALDTETEFEEACRQVERIAQLRLEV